MSTKPFFINSVRPAPAAPGMAFFAMLLMALLFVSDNLLAATVSARLDRSTITLGETATLTIDVSGAGSTQPDLRPLKKDFDIVNTGTSTQIQIINGHRSDRRELNISLQAHKTGQLTIPAIHIGKQQTRPLKLTVKDIPAVSQSAYGKSVWIEMDSPMKKYDRDIMVQQEVPVTVKLFTSLPLTDVSLSAPSAEHTIVEKLGDDIQYDTQRNGKHYQVVEQHYVLFPEQAGDLVVKPVILRALTPDNSQPQKRSGSTPFKSGFDDPFNDPFFKNAFGGNSRIQQMLQRSRMMLGGSQGKSITLRSNGIRFDVAHIPEEARGQSWLPARQVSLSSSWQTNPPALVTGEPATLTIAVKADGLTGTQIPTLQIPENSTHYSVYAEPAEMKSLTDGEHAIGISKQTFTIIPEQAGALNLPEIKLAWWNTRTRQLQWARLPGLKLNVKQGITSNAPQQPLTPDSSENTPLPDESTSNATPSAATQTQLMQFITENREMFWGFVIILILVSIAFFRYSKQVSRNTTVINEQKTASREQQKIATQKLKLMLQEAITACENGNAQQTASALLQWAKLAWPDLSPVSLIDIADNIVAGADNIRQLHQYLYQPYDPHSHWQDPQLAELLRKGLQRKTARTQGDNKNTLPPLYPA